MITGDGLEPIPVDSIYLTDISPQDKPWDVHRSEADKVKHLYSGSVYDCYAERIAGCSGVLEFGFVADECSGVQRLKLKSSHFCRVRHCPVCQWRRQLRWRARFFDALPKLLNDYPKARFIFLTLTVRNCPVENLREQLAIMNKAWTLLSKRKKFPALGWLKSVEVTRSQIGEAHPHFHAILMVHEGYFKRGYVSKETWVKMWRESLRCEYDPSVHVRVVKSGATLPDELHSELHKGFCEVLKYSLKPEDLTSSQEWLLEITKQLHKTRAVAVGGVFRNYVSDQEPEDLIGEDEDPEDTSDGNIWFGWREALSRYKKVDNPT